MRIAIREQLGLLILLASLVSLAIVTIASWVSNHGFVLNIRSQRLALVASLKAAQLASNLQLMQTTANFVSTRVLIQAALQRYNQGNDTDSNWTQSQEDMAAAIGGGGSLGQTLLLQTVIFPKNATNGYLEGGPAFGTTSSLVNNSIRLPYDCPDGSQAYLGMALGQCEGRGFPPSLYPNLTFTTGTFDGQEVQQAGYEGKMIGPGASDVLLLGPWQVNSSFSLVSMTLPIVNNTSDIDVLGWLTAVLDARLIMGLLQSTQGLGDTGTVLLVGPADATNTFPDGVLWNSNNGSPPSDFEVRYVVPLNSSNLKAHSRESTSLHSEPFPAQEYDALYQALTKPDTNDDPEQFGARLRSRTESGFKVSTGYAMVPLPFVDWLILVEMARSEVWEPIDHLRDVLLACVFATAAFMAIVAFPLAHFASLPIRRLREATTKSIEPPGMSNSRSSLGSFDSARDAAADGDGIAREMNGAEGHDAALAGKEGWKDPVSAYRHKRREERQARREAKRKQQFRIPGKVKERKHLVKDELSDLTATFNEMSDELMMQYSRLEERVQQRTAELETSKKAAEAANESKTLFIANISHELKTPLNGILGMTAVCMSEDDPVRLKRSLGVIYKSGDLLLNLLTDLLTFSKNQVGQHLNLEEKEFRLRDVSSQILAIFEKQAKEGQIDLRVEWQGIHFLPHNESSSPERTELGPHGTGRMKDMILWGDLQRILQVVINLCSNSLKFTPAGGSVVLTIRCLPETPDLPNSRKTSLASKQSRQSRQISSRHKGSDATLQHTPTRTDTANAINPRERPYPLNSRDRDVSPPPGQYLYFEFEVTDTGPGIPENLQAKIFEPFVQGDLGLSKKYGGTGLGLSICSQLATLMRGSIGVQSVVGQGSTFTMKVPLRHLKTRADSSASSSVSVPSRAPSVHHSLSLDDGEKAMARHSRALTDESSGNAAAAEAAANPSPMKTGAESQPRLVGLSQPFFASSQPMESPGSQPAAMEKIEKDAERSGSKIRVLVAEDNKVNQEVVLRMLKLEDIYDVTVAKDGQEALDLVKETLKPSTPDSPQHEKPFNLIFMDVQMPNVDGLQSTRLIREIGYQAPIVALTAFAEESNIRDCMESGMNHFLSKPIRRPQLKKVLKEFCAPIPEETEEGEGAAGGNAAAGGGGVGTQRAGALSEQQRGSMIIVNSPVAMDGAESPRPKHAVVEQAKESCDEGCRPVSPVSPFTNV